MPKVFEKLGSSGRAKAFVVLLVIALMGILSLVVSIVKDTYEADAQMTTYNWVDVDEIWVNNTIDTTEADTSYVLEIGKHGYFGIQYMTESASGTPKIDILYEVTIVSPTSNFWSRAADSLIADDLTTENYFFIKSLTPPCARWMRIIVVGQATNPTDTTIWMWLARGS